MFEVIICFPPPDMILRNLEILQKSTFFVSVSILLTTRYNYSHLLNGLHKTKDKESHRYDVC